MMSAISCSEVSHDQLIIISRLGASPGSYTKSDVRTGLAPKRLIKLGETCELEQL
jgi:hypothetical protein